MDGIELGNPGKLGPTLDQVPLGLGLKVGNPRYRRLYCGVAKLQLGPLNLGFRHGNSGPGGLESRLCPVPFAFTDGILLKQARDPVPLAFRLVQFPPWRLPALPWLPGAPPRRAVDQFGTDCPLFHQAAFLVKPFLKHPFNRARTCTSRAPRTRPA